MRFLPLVRVRGAAMGVGVLAATMAVALVPSSAAAHHDRWNWSPDGDAASWSGAGGGWNGGTTSTGTGPADWTPQATAEIAVRDLRIDRAAISPNGDGDGDEVFVSFRLRRSSDAVRVTVVDAGGTVVRTLGEVRVGSGAARFGWDGTTDADVAVADGAYRIVLTPAANARDGDPDSEPLSVEVLVDSVAPSIGPRRPTLAQLNALARRAGELRDARRRWVSRGNRGNGHGHGNRGNQRHGNGDGHGRWSDEEGQWVRLWESRQLRLPVTFSTVEDGDVAISAQVGGRTSSMATWRTAGRHTLDVALPTYVARGKLTVTFATRDDAGNAHRHTIVALLPDMPAPRPLRRTAAPGDRTNGSAPVTGVPTSAGGPFPDWLDPIMLRATYGAGVPQSWARSQALSNLVFRESSYRPTAQNPTSTAYGLFQFLDQTWATVGCRKTSDAYQQSVCGLRYIQRRYRTPEAAWRFWQANHWY